MWGPPADVGGGPPVDVGELSVDVGNSLLMWGAQSFIYVGETTIDERGIT